MDNIVVKILIESWLVLGQMAPYLLLGFLVAGVLSVCISPAWLSNLAAIAMLAVLALSCRRRRKDTPCDDESCVHSGSE